MPPFTFRVITFTPEDDTPLTMVSPSAGFLCHMVAFTLSVGGLLTGCFPAPLPKGLTGKKIKMMVSKAQTKNKISK